MPTILYQNLRHKLNVYKFYKLKKIVPYFVDTEKVIKSMVLTYLSTMSTIFFKEIRNREKLEST